MTSLFCRLFTVLVDINAVFFFQASEGKMSRNAYPKPCVTYLKMAAKETIPRLSNIEKFGKLFRPVGPF